MTQPINVAIIDQWSNDCYWSFVLMINTLSIISVNSVTSACCFCQDFVSKISPVLLFWVVAKQRKFNCSIPTAVISSCYRTNKFVNILVKTTGFREWLTVAKVSCIKLWGFFWNTLYLTPINWLADKTVHLQYDICWLRLICVIVT